MKQWIFSGALISLVVACSPSAPPVDLEAARKAILDADKAWSKTATDPVRFASFFTQDGAFYPDSAPMEQGPAAIQAFAERLLATPGFSATWFGNEGGRCELRRHGLQHRHVRDDDERRRRKAD